MFREGPFQATLICFSFKVLSVFSFILFDAELALAVSSNHVRCPKMFLGRVDSIVKNGPPLSTLHKQKVRFTVLNTQDEKVGAVEEINVLDTPSLKFEVGERYIVSMRGKYLCQVRPIEI